jgi:hypothetical protein
MEDRQNVEIIRVGRLVEKSDLESRESAITLTEQNSNQNSNPNFFKHLQTSLRTSRIAISSSICRLLSSLCCLRSPQLPRFSNDTFLLQNSAQIHALP